MLFVSTALFISCDRPLESVAVTVESGAGSGIYAVSAMDLGRRPADEQSFIVPLDAEKDRPFRYRIGPKGDEEIRLDGEEPRIIVTVSGEIEGGEITVFSGEHGQRYPFSRTLRDHRRTDRKRYRLSFPLDSLRNAPWEVEFSAPTGSTGYHVEEILLGYTTTDILFPARTAPERPVSVDTLLPLVLNDTSLELPALRGVIRDPSHALLMEYEAPDRLFDDRSNRPVVHMTIRGSGEPLPEKRLEIRLRPGRRSITIRPEQWLPGAESVLVEGTDRVDLYRIGVLALPDNPWEPIPIDLEELQSWPIDLWRREDFELFSWSVYPGILWIDHRAYETQARMFKRLAFFVEKRGYQGRLLSNEQLRDRHGWNAHNYRPEGLAAFFNAAHASGFALNSEEIVLREIAVEHGLLVEGNRENSGLDRWLPGSGGVLSISRSSFPSLRRLLTVHEAMHGVFYEEPAFRRAAFEWWDREMDTRERDFWQAFFSWVSYDPDDRYLMVNEFQAYLLQQGEAAADWYFGTRTADRLRAAQPQRAESIDLMLRDYPDTFVRAAAAVNESLFSVSGMVGGDPFCLRPVE